MAVQQVAWLARGVEHQPAPVPGHLDVETAETAREGGCGRRHHDQPVVALDETCELAQDRKHRTVVEQVRVVHQHRKVGSALSQPHEQICLVGTDEHGLVGPRQPPGEPRLRREDGDLPPSGA